MEEEDDCPAEGRWRPVVWICCAGLAPLPIVKADVAVSPQAWTWREGSGFSMAAAQPADTLSVTLHWQRGRKAKLVLTRRAGGALHTMCRDKRPGDLQSQLSVPELFKLLWRMGGLRGSWQRQMTEQSVGHRMQLLLINCFLITIRLTATLSFKEQEWKVKFPFGLLMGASCTSWNEAERKNKLYKNFRSFVQEKFSFVFIFLILSLKHFWNRYSRYKKTMKYVC